MHVTNIIDVINYILAFLKLYIPFLDSYNWLINKTVKDCISVLIIVATCFHKKIIRLIFRNTLKI